jgi:hypothetical protein
MKQFILVLLVALSALGCQKDVIEQTTFCEEIHEDVAGMGLVCYEIPTGRHHSTTRIDIDDYFLVRPGKLTWDFVFDESCAYNLGDEDQKDWNKLCGVSFGNPLSNLDETAMIGWRYSLETDLIELNAYYHVNSDRFFTVPLAAISMCDQVGSAVLEIDYVKKWYTWSIVIQDDVVTHTWGFDHNSIVCNEINFYFGGNEAAPHTVRCYKRRS